MRQLKAVSLNTVKEILRDRVLYGLIIFAIFLVVLGLLLGQLSFSEQARIITDLGLVASELGCGMLAIFVGSSLVWREIDRQTVLTLLSKPVSRTTFILGKGLGLGAVLLLVNFLISVILIGVFLMFGKIYWGSFLIAEAAIFLESLLLLSFSIFFGVFCRPMLTTFFTLSVWLLGHGVGDLAFFSEKSREPFMKVMGQVLYRVFPNLDFFNFKTAAVYGDVIAAGDIFKATSLWGLWTLILGLATVWIFSRRDFI